MSVAEMLEIKLESFAVASLCFCSKHLFTTYKYNTKSGASIMNSDSDDTFFYFHQAAAATFSFIQGEKYCNFASNYKKKCLWQGQEWLCYFHALYYSKVVH